MLSGVHWSLCIGCFITQIANFLGITLNNIPYIPPSFLDDNLLRNSRQFKLIRDIWVWKDEVGDEDVDEELVHNLQDIENIGTYGLESVGIGEEDPQEEVPTQIKVTPQRKRQRLHKMLMKNPLGLMDSSIVYLLLKQTST